jgi:translocation and assembly module TamB
MARQVSLDASGDLSSEGGGLTDDGPAGGSGPSDHAVRGPANITAEIASASEGWEIDAALSRSGRARRASRRSVGLEAGASTWKREGSVPLALANRFIAPQSINGQLSFDLGVAGQPGLDAVSGRFSTTGARVVAPTLRLALEKLGLDASLSGGGSASMVTARSRPAAGSACRARSMWPAPVCPGSIDITLDAVRLVDPSLYKCFWRRARCR